MNCLNCGCISEHYLCSSCATITTLNRLFREIRFYKPDTCTNPYLQAYVSGLSEKYAERDIIPEILAQFDPQSTEYYSCIYLQMSGDSRFEDAARDYLETHELSDFHTQDVLYNLIRRYIPDNLTAPQALCELVRTRDDLFCELYAIAAKYFSMIGDYNLADAMVGRAQALCEDPEHRKLLYYSPEGMLAELEKQRITIQKYRTKKPYWPTTESRRRVVACFYDERGIPHPRVESKPAKVPESEFAPVKSYRGGNLSDYCAFWCSSVFSAGPSPCIYQIAAVKVLGGQVADTFAALVRPWDVGDSSRKAAARESGISLGEIEAADDVDLVMPKFFAFVEHNVLVSTEALGLQKRLLSRAARYAGMHGIENEFLDLLDLAADISEQFDFENNSRDHLLTCFQITEGKNAPEKALANKQLYDVLIRLGEVHV